MGFIRLILFGFILLSVIYVAISIYSRSVRREKLEDRWAEEHPDDMESPERDAYIETGMTEYQNSIRPKLVLLVYIVPTLAVGIILYLINAN